MTSSTTTPPRTAAGLSTTSEASSSARPLSSSLNDSTPRLRPPRSLPPWISPYDKRIGTLTDEQLRLLVNPPAASVHPQHNALPHEPQRRVSKDGFINCDDPKLGPAQVARGKIPHFLKYGHASQRGRKWDHLRSAEPVIVSAHGFIPSKPVTWGEFVQSSAWGHIPNEKSEVVDPEVFNQLQPRFNDDFDFPSHLTDSRRRKSVLSKRIWNRVMRGSLAPLLFRLTVIGTSILALGIAVRMFEIESDATHDSAERTQSVFAVAVDCVAIPFNGYMIWDEYTGKPLGLRSAVSKMSLILLDLFFIIFKSASTALAFESVVYHSPGGHMIRALSKTLAGLMLLGLLAWAMNLTVNIFRVIEKLGGGEDDK